jgi:hypothetical protein
MAGRKLLIPGGRRRVLWIGYLGIVLGSYALYEAYEKRGAKRPFATKLLPGP